LGVSGTVATDAAVGPACTLIIRAMCSQDVVAEPAVAQTSITVAKPETESKTPAESAGWKQYVIAGAAALAGILVFVIYKRIKANREKAAKQAADAKESADQTVTNAGESSVGGLKDKTDSALKDIPSTNRLEAAREALDSALKAAGSELENLREQRKGFTNPFDPEAMRLDSEIKRIASEIERNSNHQNTEKNGKDAVGESEESMKKE
jgi:hypothetical protein